MTKQISDEQARAWVVANKQDRVALASLSRASGVSVPTIKARMGKFLAANPTFLASLNAAAVPATPMASAQAIPVMDDPEMVAPQDEAAAAANEDLARAHARELHAKTNLVIGVQAYFEWRAEGQTGQPLAQ